MSSFLHFYFIIELIILFILVKKHKTPNVLVVGYLLFFIYAQTVYVNYLLFDVDYIFFRTFSSLDFYLNSESFVTASTYYFLFMFTYGLYGMFIKVERFNINLRDKFILLLNVKTKTLIICLTFFILYYHLLSFGMIRSQKKEFSLIGFDFIIFYFTYYIWGTLFLYEKKKTVYFYILTFIVFFHALFSLEREYIVLIGLFLLFKYKKYFKGYTLLGIAFVGFLLISYWKHFYLHVVVNSRPITTFLSDLQVEVNLSSSDSIAGMSLLTNYFEKDIYGDYYLSYVTNAYNQVYRMFFDSNYMSLAEYTTYYYTRGSMGTAFSMILESILNFGFLGPIILPFVLIKIVTKVLAKNRRMFDLFSVVLIFLLLKLVRTEVMVLLKLYVLPFLLYYYFFIKKMQTQR